MAYSDEDLIKAALMDDPEESAPPSQTEVAETPANNKPEGQAGDPPKDPPKADPDPDDKQPKTPEAAEENPDDPKDPKEVKPGEAEEPGEKTLTRKEKREARHKAFIESVKREQEQKPNARERLFQRDPNYKPLDYNEAPSLDVKDLAADRTKFGQEQFSQGAETERYYADQENFWTRTEYEGKLLEQNPEFKFLDENDQENFDPDKAQEINGMYLELVGFDPNTKTVKRTDISYEKFVRYEVDRAKRWAEELAETSDNNLAEVRGNSGIRPGSSSRGGLGKLKPGDISKMSQEEFEKYEADIDRQILAELA